MHGGHIIKYNIVPMGHLTEEALEAKNKDFRRFRQFHTRKSDRKASNHDLLNMLLLSSDPLLSNMSSVLKKNKLKMTPALRSLLVVDDQNNEGSSTLHLLRLYFYFTSIMD